MSYNCTNIFMWIFEDVFLDNLLEYILIKLSILVYNNSGKISFLKVLIFYNKFIFHRNSIEFDLVHSKLIIK